MDRYTFGSLHLDKVPVLHYDIRVTLQRGVMAYTVVNWHTSRKSDTWGRERVNELGSAESETLTVTDETRRKTYLSSCPFPSWRFSQFLPWWRRLPFHTGWARRLQPLLPQLQPSEPLQDKTRKRAMMWLNVMSVTRVYIVWGCS